MRSAQSTRGSRSLAALAASGVAACAAMDGELTAARESWRGATYDQAQRSGGGVGGVIFGGAPGGVAARCERTLVIQDARVVREGEWSGVPEFCKRFRRPP
jgi:hypothetical protein